MAKLTQHIPAAARDGRETLEEWEFNSVEELLELEWVTRFKTSKFHRFSKSDNHLMVETDEGYTWWVVGYVDDPESLNDLPEWEPKKRE